MLDTLSTFPNTLSLESRCSIQKRFRLHSISRFELTLSLSCWCRSVLFDDGDEDLIVVVFTRCRCGDLLRSDIFSKCLADNVCLWAGDEDVAQPSRWRRIHNTSLTRGILCSLYEMKITLKQLIVGIDTFCDFGNVIWIQNPLSVCVAHFYSRIIHCNVIQPHPLCFSCSSANRALYLCLIHG